MPCHFPNCLHSVFLPVSLLPITRLPRGRSILCLVMLLPSIPLSCVHLPVILLPGILLPGILLPVHFFPIIFFPGILPLLLRHGFCRRHLAWLLMLLTELLRLRKESKLCKSSKLMPQAFQIQNSKLYSIQQGRAMRAWEGFPKEAGHMGTPNGRLMWKPVWFLSPFGLWF